MVYILHAGSSAEAALSKSNAVNKRTLDLGEERDGGSMPGVVVFSCNLLPFIQNL
jgi:hypothetical protein